MDIISKPNKLCSRLLTCKYSRGVDLMNCCIVKPSDSPLWKSLATIWSNITFNISWDLCNGSLVRFSEDRWFRSENALTQIRHTPISDDKRDVCVNEMVHANGTWNLAGFQDLVPQDISLKIRANLLPRNFDGEDVFRWNLEADDVTASFYTDQIHEWFHSNLAYKLNVAGSDNWNTIFEVMVRSLWKWRNEMMFEEGFKYSNEPVKLILRYVEEILNKDTMLLKGGEMQTRIEIGWTFPPEGWVKLNADGVAKGQPRPSGCGELVRGVDGRWLGGFTNKLDICISRG